MDSDWDFCAFIFFIFLNIYLIIYLLWEAREHAPLVHIQRSEDTLQEWVLSFHHVGLGMSHLVVTFGDMHVCCCFVIIISFLGFSTWLWLSWNSL